MKNMPCCPETCAMPYSYRVCRTNLNKAAGTGCESVQRPMAHNKIAIIGPIASIADLHVGASRFTIFET